MSIITVLHCILAIPFIIVLMGAILYSVVNIIEKVENMKENRRRKRYDR